MSSLHRPREKHKKSSRLAPNNDDEGSAARTRPFSYEEIMLRRKRKILSEDLKDGVLEAETASGKGDVKNVSDRFESQKGYRRHKDSPPIDERHVTEEETKLSSRKKEKSTSTNSKSEENHLKGRDIVTHVSERRLKSVVSRPNDDMNNEIRGGKSDKQIHGRRENDKLSTDNARNEGGKKYSRESTVKESHAELRRGNSERESKRKYQNGDHEKTKDRNVSKKLHAERHHETEISGRNKWKESLKSHLEEPKTRRGRSRSRDRDDRNRRSKSPSTRDHKRTSYNRTAHRDVSPHSHKDRSQKQNHFDRNKLSSNGSSSHYRRHDEPTSGLGGYSPRKRITEAAAKTPPPPDHISERKSAKWDMPPPGTHNILSGSVPSDFQSSCSIVATSVRELDMAAPIVSTSTKLPLGVFATTLLTKKLASVDSVQLTQATRPMRRLYVENIPSSTSEKALVEWFNDLLLSSGVNHIHGTQPCINCIINKEKAQALAEFLTPEDASTAVSFDGSSISGSVLKIRRPKDFVEAATGDMEKSIAAVDTTSDVVKDSPNKIFIGGISNVLSSKMLMEIVSAFGPLKAYRFEFNDNLNEPCAFLEYVDQSTTLKACAGLNGMKLGGKVLTVVRAIRGEASLGNIESSPSYEIPDHAKPLLKQPTQILKLKNAFNEEGLSLLSEPEIEEIIDDIRLECARFGNVKSVNIVKQGNSQTTCTVTCELDDNPLTAGFGKDLGRENNNGKTHNSEGRINSGQDVTELIGCVSDAKELQEEEVTRDNYTDDDKNVDNIMEDKPSQTSQFNSDIAVEVEGCEYLPNIAPEEFPKQPKSPKETSEDLIHSDDKVFITIPTDAEGSEVELKPEENPTSGDADGRAVDELDVNIKTESSAVAKDDAKERVLDLGSVFEVGCVFVEFGRTEAACMAAHCLHGRVFDGRIVSVEYVSLDHYKARFPI